MRILLVGMLCLAGGCGYEAIPTPPASPAKRPSGAESNGKSANGHAVNRPDVDAGIAVENQQPKTFSAGEPERDAVLLAPAQPPQEHAQVRILADTESSIAVRAITHTTMDEVRVGVVSKLNGATALLAVGKTFQGYELLAYDPATDMAIFNWQGEKVGLFVSEGNAVSPNEPADGYGDQHALADPVGVYIDIQPQHTDAPIDLRTVPAKIYEPTEKEREAGIDPNDETTWPDDYKGPGIERMLECQEEAGIDPPGMPPGMFPPPADAL